MIKRTVITFCLCLALVAGAAVIDVSAQEVELTKLWELEGFSRPECVIYDAKRDVLYVTNVTEQAKEEDRSGLIAKVSLKGEILVPKWISGLQYPLGMAFRGDELFVADFDRLLQIDPATGKIVHEYTYEGQEENKEGVVETVHAELMNDIAVDGDGSLYVSDKKANRIYKLAAQPAGSEGEAKLELFVKSSILRHPNGLCIYDGNLIVASWGSKGGVTFLKGHLKKIPLDTKKIGKVGKGSPIGHLDGIEPDGKGNFYVSDWDKYDILLVTPTGSFKSILDLDAGPADFEYIPDKEMFIIPVTKENKVVAYKKKSSQ